MLLLRHVVRVFVLSVFFSVIAAVSVLADDASTPASLSVPGDYQAWNPATAPLLAPVNGAPGKFEGYVNFTGGGPHFFKFTSAPDWTHTNYGDGGTGSFSTDGKAAGLSVPEGGYYELTADLKNNKWTATKTNWSIIGNATPGGWKTDTAMNFDPATQLWTVTADMKAAGSFKFRANDAWLIDFGVDDSGNLQYVDNPFLTYNPGFKDLTVPTDGNYTITLDLHVPGKYSFKLSKN
jgi:hypothetical protein